ncbi:MAG: CGNR zinc finger domain-containing protein [Acidimicrobiales bacterium]
MLTIVQSPPIEFLVDLVNHWAEAVHHKPAPVEGRDYPPPKVFAERYGIRLDEPIPNVDLVSVADDYYSVFTAAPPDRLVCANDLLPSAKLSPVLQDVGLAWKSGQDSLARALAASSLLLYAQSDPSLARFGVCTAHRCRDAYLDGSQGRTRRFCTERCQTRAKARRRRQ